MEKARVFGARVYRFVRVRGEICGRRLRKWNQLEDGLRNGSREASGDLYQWT
jgi:hypothetical protein